MWPQSGFELRCGDYARLSPIGRDCAPKQRVIGIRIPGRVPHLSTSSRCSKMLIDKSYK